MTKKEKTFIDLKKNLTQVEEDLSFLIHIDDIFHQVLMIIKTNPSLNKYDFFQSWLIHSYINTLLVGLRRLVDENSKSVSLISILVYTKKNLTEVEKFLAEPPKGNKITEELLEKKIKKLKEEFKYVIKLTNNYITHRQIKAKKQRFNFDEIRNPLAHAFKIFHWCKIIIHHQNRAKAVAEIQTNWFEVFQIPWLEKDKPLPKYVKLDELL